MDYKNKFFVCLVCGGFGGGREMAPLHPLWIKGGHFLIPSATDEKEHRYVKEICKDI